MVTLPTSPSSIACVTENRAPHPMDLLFDAATASASVDIPERWGQGRATFGGLLAGVLQARGLGEWDLNPAELRSSTTSFIAPATPGPARLETLLLRNGSSATQTEVRLWQVDERTGTDQVRTVQLSSYGAPRASNVSVAPTPAPSTPAEPDALPIVPYLRGMTPDFLAHVELRPTRGGMPFSGAPSGDLCGFMRYRQAPAAMTLPHLLCLIDGWPPPPGAMLRTPAAMSTLSWTVEMLAPVTGAPEQFWRYDAVTDAAHDGYGHTHARIFTEDGSPVAISRQTISIFG